MSSGGLLRGASAAILVLMLVAPLAAAQDQFEWFVQPKTENAEMVYSLFMIISVLAIIVFVGVNAALFYTIWRFRKNKNVPRDEAHRGHTKAEIAWTVVPAIVLIFIGVMSVQTLAILDTVPEEPDFTVRVEAQQFAWLFHYPDNTTTVNQLFVEEGRRVHLEVVSSDVVHAVWIPQFGVKLDAYPDRVNHQWFESPGPGEYFLQCAEYCGLGHHAMHAYVVVFAAGEGPDGLMWGDPAAPPGVDPNVPVDVELEMALLESPGPFGRWSIDPTEVTVTVGQGVHVLSVNPAGNSVHNWTIPAFGVTTPPQPGGQNARTAFIADQVGSFEYICGIPGHRSIGMRGTLTVVAG